MGDTPQMSPAPRQDAPVAGRDVSLAPVQRFAAPAAGSAAAHPGLRAADTILSGQTSSTTQTAAGIATVLLHQPHARVSPLLASLAGVFPRGATEAD